jgi:predicted metalloenzyme YecM
MFAFKSFNVLSKGLYALDLRWPHKKNHKDSNWETVEITYPYLCISLSISILIYAKLIL